MINTKITAYNNLPALLALNPVARRASFRSHSLAPLRPDLGSPMLAQTSQVGTVTRNWARAYWIRRRIIGWGSVVRIQRVWRKSLPVIRRKEDIFRSRDRKISGLRTFRWVSCLKFQREVKTNLPCETGLLS